MNLEKVVTNFINISIFPIIALNFLGGIAGGIWLIISGWWELVLLSFVFGVFSPLVLSIPLFVIGLISAGVVTLIQKTQNKLVLGVGGFLLSFLQHLLYLTWVLLVFTTMLTFSEGYNPIPFLLLGYGIATGPFVWMASKEPRDSYGSFISVFLMQVFYIILFLFFLFDISFLAIPVMLIITVSFDIFLAKIVLVEVVFQKQREKLFDKTLTGKGGFNNWLELEGYVSNDDETENPEADNSQLND